MHTATTLTTKPTARRKRLAAVALAAASLVAGLGLDASPASADAPSTPTAVVAAGYNDYARIYWAQPENADPAVTSYSVQRTLLGSEIIQKSWVRSDAEPLLDTGLNPGVSYRYRIKANNADGSSSWIQTVAYTNPGRGDLYRFGYDAEDFVKRQYQDLLGRQPNAFELATHAQAIELKTSTPGEVLDEIAHNGTRMGQRHPIIRLYRAYFDRAPDHSGLDYWVKKRASGTTNLDFISAQFAGSSEFKNKYGNLTHSQFVDLVYNNLFDRDPDPAGKAYWVNKLNQGTSRGRVMTQFSESNEYRNESRGVVEAADLLDDMLGSAGAPSTVALWGGHIQGGGNQGEMGIALTLLNSY